MDYVERHNEKAVVSRMKRLVERMHQDNAQVFKELGIAFEPRWFLIFSLLDEFGAMAVMDVARALNIKHPTVNVMVAELIKKGYVEDHIDAQDKRKRLLSLSPMGQRMIVDLKPLWNDMAAAAQELIEETGYDVIDVLASLERALDRESYYERQRRHILQRQWQTIVIRPYWDGDQPAFRDLNSAWIALEDEPEIGDQQPLARPRPTLIDREGGTILVAALDETVVGTVAVWPVENVESKSRKSAKSKTLPTKVMALGYFALAESTTHQPSNTMTQVGQKLLEAAVAQARAEGATVIHAEVNRNHHPTVNALRQVGFLMTPLDSPFRWARSNTWMVLRLDE